MTQDRQPLGGMCPRCQVFIHNQRRHLARKRCAVQHVRRKKP